MKKITKRNLTKTYHIIFDAVDCNKKRICTQSFVFNLVVEITKLVDMKILAGPNIIRDYEGKNPGITAIAVISFSHISVHTFEKTGEVFIDIFSCRPFNYKKVTNYLFKKLDIGRDKVQTQEIKYPWE